MNSNLEEQNLRISENIGSAPLIKSKHLKSNLIMDEDSAAVSPTTNNQEIMKDKSSSVSSQDSPNLLSAKTKKTQKKNHSK